MNNQGVPIQWLMTQAAEHQSHYHDHFVDSDDLHFRGRQLSYVESDDTPLFGKPAGGMGELTTRAWQQIVERLDGPDFRWIANPDRCPGDLHDQILNRLAVERQNQRLMLRGYSDYIRGVLSDEYTPFDNLETLQLIASGIEMAVGNDDSMGEYKLHRAGIAGLGEYMSGYLLFPNVEVAPEPTGRGSALHPAIYFRNGEVGGSSLRIAAGVFRSVCTNGAIFGWHDEDVFILRHRWVNRESLAVLAAQAVGKALTLSEVACRMLYDTIQIQIKPVQIKSLAAKWKEKYGLPANVTGLWIAGTEQEATMYGRADDIRLFDMVNTLTALAQAQEDVSLQERMEIGAGDLVTSFFGEAFAEVERQLEAEA